MIERELKQPLDCLRAQPVPPHGTQGLQKVRARVISSQAWMNRHFDATDRVQTPSLAVGDWVWIKRAHQQHKLQSHWSDPFRVTQQLGSATYRLENGTQWHSNRLHKVPAPKTPMSSPSSAATLVWPSRPGTNRAQGGKNTPFYIYNIYKKVST
uniref:Murine leukemia virus integrase C-terminal domain-containing protein n=1 Tax=Oryzias latipes TaxID=8090 RepID=A0A3B3HP32_ORYLA